MIWWMVALWVGCLVAEALDGFRSTRELVAFYPRQWRRFRAWRRR